MAGQGGTRPAAARLMDDLLMGSGTGELNLRAVKARAEETRRTIEHLLQTLQFAPASLTWPDALDKFAVLNVQLQHFSDQLRPLLRHYVIHPRSVNQTNAPVLPIMLATRLLPEQEEEEAELLKTAPQTATTEDIGRFNAMVDVLVQHIGGLDARQQVKRPRVAGGASTGDLLPGGGGGLRGLAAGGSMGGIEKKEGEKIPSDGEKMLLAAACLGEGLR